MQNINRYIVIFVSLVFAGAVVYFFSDIVSYVLIAWVLSMLGQPIMAFLLKIKIGNFKLSTTIAAIITLISYFIVFILLIWIFVPLIAEQAHNLSEVDYGDIAQALREPFEQLEQLMTNLGFMTEDLDPEHYVKESLIGWFNPAKFGNFFGSIIGFAGNFILAIFSIAFIAFFFLRDQGLFSSFIQALVPSKYEKQTSQAIDNTSRMLTRYFGGVTIQMILITLFVSILLTILGIKNALLIGFFAALINVIPYLGPMIGAIFGMIITVSSNLDVDFYSEMLPLLIKVVGVFAAVQLLDNFFLQPYVLGNSVLAHPLEIFIIVLAGAKLGGIVGMVLAIPAYTVLRVIASVFLSEFRIVKKLTSRIRES